MNSFFILAARFFVNRHIKQIELSLIEIKIQPVEVIILALSQYLFGKYVSQEPELAAQ